MRKNPRIIGDEHVRDVFRALLHLINKKSIDTFPETAKQTAFYILKLYPNIKSITSKFDSDVPDMETDLTLYFNNDRVNINLFLIKKGRRIQPKNPGAKSFFSKYFLSNQLQETFNQIFEREYLLFLQKLLEYKVGIHYISDKKELKKQISFYFPKFTKEINLFRDNFLYSLREGCFSLLKDFYNKKSEGFFHAYNVLFMTKDITVVTNYGKSLRDVSVDQFNPGVPSFADIQIYKVGKNTVGIKYGEVALTLRFKFESSPISSIKLATSYDDFKNELENEQINSNTAQRMLGFLSDHEYIHTSNSSNAIGKCHEAITYYYFLKVYPNILQVEPNECVELLNKYYSFVKKDVLEKLYTSTSKLIPVIRKKLNDKYGNYKLESIELVPDSYISDRLDTGDLQLIIKVNGDYVVENISLKALARKSSKITTKNPGIGTILGPTYFDIGNIDEVVSEVKTRFEIGEINRRESLETLAEELGSRLIEANQKQLKQGIENLLGKAMMAVTFYEEGLNYCKEHSKIKSSIKVLVKNPSTIQNTLKWNNDLDMISLRVKFSKGQSHGWSSVKLTSEYQLK
ncbi:hypothetical protein [Niallia oryzisoli]|uniref:hypothetical protein n=1 Tax=Niallia oryzisoli TaxID=1737571 RepID=UPI0037366868